MEFTLKLPFLNGGGKDDAKPVIGDDRQQLVDSYLGGKYAALARAGKVFIGNMAAAGAVIPIYSNTAQVCGLWNPRGSEVDVQILEIGQTYIDTTQAAGGFVLGLVKNAPAGTGTGEQGISAFTDGVLNTSIFNGRLGDEIGPKARFTPSAATVTAPIIGRHLSYNQDALAATAAVNMAKPSALKFDGDLWLPPGNAVFFAGNIATLVKLAAYFVWSEHKR